MTKRQELTQAITKINIVLGGFFTIAEEDGRGDLVFQTVSHVEDKNEIPVVTITKRLLEGTTKEKLAFIKGMFEIGQLAAYMEETRAAVQAKQAENNPMQVAQQGK